MVPKPDGSKRMCIDYRNLNDSTPDASWPIPNISEIHKLFLKAKKCYFGYAEIDFVGKVLSEKGLQMSLTKIRSVIDFPKSVIAKQLKSFLGLVSYFRDFIRHQSSIVHPLHQLLLNYNKTKKIVWTLEADACFDLV